MPDLKSELMKLNNLKFDDGDEAPEVTVVSETQAEQSGSAPITERVWNYLKAHPVSGGAAISKALGLSSQTVASSLYTLFQRNLVIRTTINSLFHYTTIGDTYPPFDRIEHGRMIGKQATGRPRGSYKVDPLKHKKNKAKKVEDAEQATGVVPLPPGMRFQATVDQLLDTMSVMQARELYDALKKIFGG